MQSAVTGLALVLTSLPTGVLADKYGRDSFLKIAGVTGFVGCALLVITLLTQSLSLMYVSMGVWGAYMGIQSPAMAALFADSVPTAQRSKLFSVKHSLAMLGFSLSPLLSVFIFLIVGNEWTRSVLLPVLFIGLGISLIPSGMLCLFRDDRSLSTGSNMKITSLPSTDNHPNNTRRGCIRPKWIPYILAACDLITGCGMCVCTCVCMCVCLYISSCHHVCLCVEYLTQVRA